MVNVLHVQYKAFSMDNIPDNFCEASYYLKTKGIHKRLYTLMNLVEFTLVHILKRRHLRPWYTVILRYSFLTP